MLTGTWVEFWFAIVLWVLCLWAPIFDIDNKEPKRLRYRNQAQHPDRKNDDDQLSLIRRSPKTIRIICIVLIVIGAYTTINGVIRFGAVDTLWNIYFGDNGTVDRIRRESGGAGQPAIYAFILSVWPILAIIFGGWTFLKGIFRYKKLAERGY